MVAATDSAIGAIDLGRRLVNKDFGWKLKTIENFRGCMMTGDKIKERYTCKHINVIAST